MKIEGIVYFTGISFGTWMAKSFWHIAKFPAIVGIVFIFLGCVGYGMTLANRHVKLSKKI